MDILSKLPQLPVDKANHFVYGSAMFLMVEAFTKSPNTAMVFVAVAAALKELYDWSVNRIAKQPIHEVSGLDWLATTAGGFVCF